MKQELDDEGANGCLLVLALVAHLSDRFVSVHRL